MKIYPISRDEYLLAREGTRINYHRLRDEIRVVKKARSGWGSEAGKRINQSVAAELSRQARFLMEKIDWLKACARASVAAKRCSEAPPY